MNCARLGIASQSVGISEAAYREALAYANDRKQFGKAIIEFPAVAEMIANIKAKLDASRALLYETARFVDMTKILEDIARERTLTPEERAEMKAYSRLATAYTPLTKGMGSEFCNQGAYDCIQVHGGSGFMKDYACERIYRDARITSIYEGTTQLQVVAAIGNVTKGVYADQMKVYAAEEVSEEMKPLQARVNAMAEQYRDIVSKIDTANKDYFDLQSRRLVEIAGHTIMAYLLVNDASKAPELFADSAKVYVNYAEGEVAKNMSMLKNVVADDLAAYGVKQN